MTERHPLSAGRAAELLVQAHALMGSEYRLTAYQPVADDDHIDVVVMEHGRYGALYVQVKSADGLDREDRVVMMAEYDEDRVPESPRLVYVCCLVDTARQAITRCWLVPSAEFNRRAYRQHRRGRPGWVTLQFSARAGGDERWDGFAVPVTELGVGLEKVLAETPADASVARQLGVAP